eukprot:1386274-Pyramimonas_sp.AAC.1
MEASSSELPLGRRPSARRADTIEPLSLQIREALDVGPPKGLGRDPSTKKKHSRRTPLHPEGPTLLKSSVGH